MENFLFMIAGAIISFFGYKYYEGVKYNNVQEKIKKRKGEIGNMSTAQLVALANSILAARRGNSRK